MQSGRDASRRNGARLAHGSRRPLLTRNHDAARQPIVLRGGSGPGETRGKCGPVAQYLANHGDSRQQSPHLALAAPLVHRTVAMVRIWNLPVEELDDQHLLGEHLELHIIWNALTGQRRPGGQGRRGPGWRYHPETRRFEQRLGALYDRHEAQVAEMRRRGWHGHQTPLAAALAAGSTREWPPVTAEQRQKDREDLAAHFPGWRTAAGHPPDARRAARGREYPTRRSRSA